MPPDFSIRSFMRCRLAERAPATNFFDAASKKCVAGARAASLQRMKERMEKSGGMENYDKVIQLFTPN